MLGAIAVSLAMLCAIATLLVVADYTWVRPSTPVVLTLFALNGVFIVFLIVLLVIEIWRLIAARRAQAAGARLHIRFVALFSGIAAVPAILIAAVGSVTVERTLNPAFMKDVGGFIGDSAKVARVVGQSYCGELVRATSLTASDLDRVKSLYDSERALFRVYFSSRARILDFKSAAIIQGDGKLLEFGTPASSRIIKPEEQDFKDARANAKTCILLDDGRTLAALRQLESFDNTFLYTERTIDRFVAEFPRRAAVLTGLYQAFSVYRTNIMIAFATMFALIALIMALSAAWLGLSFANRLVQPIRRLIAATDQVASGNLYVQVAVKRNEGDLGHLGETFNKMTSELRLQQNKLVTASRINDERRMFTEAVLSGVPAAVIGIDSTGRINVVNQFAEKLLTEFAGENLVITGRTLSAIVPELQDILSQSRDANVRVYQDQISLSRSGRDRTFMVSVTGERTSAAASKQVVTLDDVTDLVTAQRTAAWADVARRIAHEIKNPLTPIQLSAERLKRKYGKVIVEDKDIFDQCTETIVRQVEDIKRMVDEFSSFARMPKPQLAEEDVCETVRQVVFLMRVGNPEIEMITDLPEEAVMLNFDRRLFSQAVTNVIKNASEGIKGASDQVEDGRITVRVAANATGDFVHVDVIDNGPGFPADNRQRLLEPYVTTRTEGTGLGLPIVAKILEDHGGGIELRDAPEGHGAWVRMSLPVSEDAPQDGDGKKNSVEDEMATGTTNG